MSDPLSHLVCALNADVVGYSRLMADDRDATSRAMVAAREQVDAAIHAHHGHLVNFVGDNFMAVFDRAIDAVHAAIAVSTAMEVVNAPKPSAQWLRFRMGIERGVVTVTDGHYEGEALNVAARIQALARPGGLAVSGAVYQQLDEPALRFRPAGAKRLKNIPEPVELYDFTDLPTDSPEDVASRLSFDIPTIAVLPLHTDAADSPLATSFSVIRDDLIHRLAAMPELTVLDAAAQGHPDTSGPGPRYLLESRVHQSGDQLRVFTTLYDVTTMNVVKGHKVAGTVADLLTISDTMAEKVGYSVEVELVVGAPATIYAEIGDPDAIEKIYMGWYHLRSFTPSGWDQAVRLFRDVARTHQETAYGHALLSFAEWIGASYGWSDDPDRSLKNAHTHARRAQEMRDPTGVGRAVEAAVLMSTGRVEEARQAIDGLHITRPTCDVTYAVEGSLKRYFGQWQEAVGLLDTAMSLTGITKPWYPTVKACSLLVGNKNEQAAAVAESVLEYQPNNVEALIVLAASQVELGLLRRAEATAAAIRDRFPGLDVEAWLDDKPYQDRSMVKRWKTSLAKVDLVVAP